MGHIVIPYVQGHLGKAPNAPAPSIVFKPTSEVTGTLKQMLVRPKDWDPKEKMSGVIYSYQYGALDCGEENISETSRTLGDR